MSFDHDQLRQELRILGESSTAKLVQLHHHLFGKEPRVRHRAHLIRRCAWRQAEIRYGGLSRIARGVLETIQKDLDIPELSGTRTSRATTRCSRLTPGTVLTREWKGQLIRVTVTEVGFDWNGQAFSSLSAVARAVTGTRWNGLVFFGLKKRKACS